jgi:hypothetical protein
MIATPELEQEMGIKEAKLDLSQQVVPNPLREQRETKPTL